VRSRPGDSILIAGLVRERDEYDVSGLGANTPLIPTGRTGQSDNSELVILLRPRVIRYVSQDELIRERADQAKLFDETPMLFDPESPDKMRPAQFDIDMLLDPSIKASPMEVK
jgi:hypothetical protein